MRVRRRLLSSLVFQVKLNFGQRLNTLARYFVEHWVGLFPRFWVSDTLFYSDQLACFRQAAGSSLPVAFLTKYLDALTNIGFPKQTTVFCKALGHVLSLSLSC
ncbi:unnamed protein product [Prunus brigantina]